MPPRIAVTGSLAYDYISSYEKPFEQVILPDKLSELSICFVVHEKVRHFGGTAGNIAYSLALLDESPALVAAVGRDFGDYKEWLDKRGVDLSYVQVVEDAITASATIMSDPKGHQIMQFHPGAMATPPNDVKKAFKDAKFVIIAPDDLTRVMAFVKSAKEANVPYFFDPGQNLPLLTPEQLTEATDGAEGLLLNDYEFEMFKKKTHWNLMDILNRARLLVITRGADGSEIYSRDTGVLSPIMVPVVEPMQFVDPTGCGDAYRSGFLKGYLEERSLETCGRMGALMATLVVEKIGTQNHTTNTEDFANRYQESFDEKLS